MKMHKLRCAEVFFFFLLLLVVSCASSISPFNQKAYEYATSLKVEALALMDQATEPFQDHQAEVQAFVTRVEKAYEYAKGLPKNEISTKQWQILKDPNRHLLGGFLKRWGEESTLSRAFVQEAQGLVADAFDTIIGLESGKIKPKSIQ